MEYSLRRAISTVAVNTGTHLPAVWSAIRVMSRRHAGRKGNQTENHQTQTLVVVVVVIVVIFFFVVVVVCYCLFV